MALKGVKRISRIINEFLKPFECTARMGTDFCYLYNKNLIFYSIVWMNNGAEDFLNSVLRLEPEVEADIFLWSLLHEVGHHETYDEISDEENDYCDDTKKKIEEGELPNELYYDMIDERLATEWAVEYANTHKEELKAFWEKLQPAIMDFYKLNKVEI